MSMIRAIVVDSKSHGNLAINQIEAPISTLSEAIVQVKAISLNRGEVRDILSAENGYKPGWDFAGIVIKQAEDGTGPTVGSRVVGLCSYGAWLEQITV